MGFALYDVPIDRSIDGQDMIKIGRHELCPLHTVSHSLAVHQHHH